MTNELQPAALEVCPQIEELLRMVSALGGVDAVLSGSGPTVFAPVSSSDAGQELVRRLNTAGFWAKGCSSIARDEFLRQLLKGACS